MSFREFLARIIGGAVIKKNTLIGVMLLGTIIVFAQETGYAQQAERYKLTLRSRSFTPQPGIVPQFRDSLAVQLDRGEKRHVFLQLNKHLTADERAELKAQGVELLSYIGAYTWHAAVATRQALNFAIPDSVSRTPILGTMRWLGEIRPEDRVNPSILADGVAPHSRGAGDTVYVLVSLHKDVSLDDGRALVERAGGRVMGEIGVINALQVAGLSSIVNRLIEYDEVKWVDQLPPEGQDYNDELRTTISADVVVAAPYSLDGTGVTVGQWEVNNVRNHNAFTGRLTIGDPPAAYSNHATHVCGTILGDGTGSAAYRGIADNASVISFRGQTVGGALNVASIQPQYTTALSAPHNIVLSTNSWGPGYYHWYPAVDYDAGMEFYDRVICGELGRAISIVAAAGNSGLTGGLDFLNSAKNTIVVGACYSDPGYFRMACFSSRGPTGHTPFANERLKPDVVAPGDEASDDLNNPCGDGDMIRSTIGDANSYGEDAGTSMSTPAVAGVVALMIEQYRLTFHGGMATNEIPYPSTIKAILCQTTDDLIDDPDVNPGTNYTGPDFFSGYGRVNAQAAVDLIIERRFREGVIESINDVDIYTIDVTTAGQELKVTLVWDDVAANPGDLPGNILKNDLDLVLINPANSEFYPPWELDPTNPANPAERNSFATEALADLNRDDVNVVEQVAIDNAQAGTWIIKVKPSDLPEPSQRYSLAANYVLEGKVEIVQVLDRSGSMLSSVALGSTDRKIDVLQTAADLVVDLVEPDVGHKMGLVKYREYIVQFTSNVDLSNEVSITTVPSYKTTLHNMIGLIDDDMQGRHMTSIGNGLNEAFSQFSTHGDIDNRQVILLMTDGKGNSTLGVDDVWATPAWTNNKAIIYTLGLGYSGGICSDTLAWLADSTGGDYRETTDPLELTKFFIEALASAVDWGPITDPVKGLPPGGRESFPVVVTEYDRGVVFTAFWSEIDDALDLVIYNPDGDSITVGSPGVRYVKNDRYILYNVRRTESSWVGEWTMEVISRSGQSVDYSISSLAESSLKLDTGFDRLHNLTGDRIRVWANIKATPVIPLPPPRPDIIAYCNKPLEGVGNALHEFKYDPSLLQPSDSLADYDPITNKLEILRRRLGKDFLPRDRTELILYDDGAHDDRAANDGFYANSFVETETQGSYTFRFVASGISGGGGLNTTREWTKSFYNEVNIEPEHSGIDVRQLAITADGKRYSVKIVPKDRFGNYLGPGHPVAVVVSYAGTKRKVQLSDNIDGTYTKEIFISQSELDANAKLEIEIDGIWFSTVVPPIPYPWSVSMHAGTAVPTGTYANLFDPGINFLIDFDYHFDPNLSLVAFFGYNDFKSKITGISDTYWLNLSLNARYTRPWRGPWSFYVGAGPGLYIPETGDKEAGANAGFGFNYNYSSRVNFELGADYHTIFDPDIQFIHSHAGIIFRF